MNENIILSFVLFQVGCGIQNKEEVPNTVAFQDEFTKNFLETSKEVVEGHYLFKSQTDLYTVHIPINASMHKAVYQRAGDEFEAVGIVENDQEQNLSIYYNIFFDNQPRANDIEFKLDMFETYLDYTGDFEESIRDSITYYYAEDKFEFEGKKSLYYFGYIKPPIENIGIQFIGTVTCIDYEKPCKQDSKEANEQVLNIMHSINFINDNPI